MSPFSLSRLGWYINTLIGHRINSKYFFNYCYIGELVGTQSWQVCFINSPDVLGSDLERRFTFLNPIPLLYSQSKCWFLHCYFYIQIEKKAFNLGLALHRNHKTIRLCPATGSGPWHLPLTTCLQFQQRG